MASALPPSFSATAYKQAYSDLSSMSDAALLDHYMRYGRTEGRRGHALATREAFAALIGPDQRALEVGPFAAPLLSGANVRFCDVLNTADLKVRAKELSLDPSRVPNIDYVLGPKSLDGIDATFDAVLSSHSIEHQPDLVNHLQQVERRLVDGGRYFALVPDKRFCFDHQIAPSTIADVLQAHEERRSLHSLKATVEHRVLTGHNDPARHWAERNERQAVSGDPALVTQALKEYADNRGRYVDLHTWYFTPVSFSQLMSTLKATGHIGLTLERLYRPSRANEFWAVLTRGPVEVSAEELALRTPERQPWELEVEHLQHALRDARAEIERLKQVKPTGFAGFNLRLPRKG